MRDTARGGGDDAVFPYVGGGYYTLFFWALWLASLVIERVGSNRPTLVHAKRNL